MILRPRAALLLLLVCVGCKDSKAPTPKKSEPKAETKATPEKVAASAPPAARKAAPWTPPPGPEVCADCHPDFVDGFAETGMGRSLYRPGAQPVIEDFDPKKATVKHDFTGLVYRAYIDEEGRWWQEERKPGTDFVRRVEAKYVIGSGNHTRSYLGEVEGEIVELPLTWYAGRKIWDMSPGYTHQALRFTRPARPKCLFCHNDLSPIRENTLAGYERFAEGISCARCHGDGSAHVAQRQAGRGPPAGQPDPTILNPKRLDAKGQLRVCQQCHLTGEARVLMEGQRWDRYDPRTPLHDYMSIYVYTGAKGAEFGISSHGDRLALSKCFTESKGQLACTKCHDPHKKSDARSKAAACLECHTADDCGDMHGQKATDDCARCHMHSGGTSDIPHVEFTDHWIRRKPGKADDEAKQQKPLAQLELVDVLAETRAGPDPQAEVRLGIAHAQIWRIQGKKQHHPAALVHLRRGLEKTPERVQGWKELGEVLIAVRDWRAALDAFAEVEKRAPEKALFRLEQAEAHQKAGDLKAAEKTLKEAVRLRPDYRAGWVNLGNVLQHQGRFEEAEQAYTKADAIGPHVSLTANNRGYNAIQRGDFKAAEAWFREALKRDPINAMGHFNLGTLALRKDDKDAAKAHLKDALEVDPKFGLAWWIQGRMKLNEGNLGGARGDFEKAVEYAADNAGAWLDLAKTAHRAGDQQGAIDALNRAQRALPGHPQIRVALQKAIGGLPPAP